jgi:hypothetical protein
MQKQIKLKHGISENGELQVYQIDQILDDAGNVLTEKTHPPYSPADPKDMKDFDAKSIELVAAVEDKKVKTDFVAEKQEPTGVGLEEIVKYDRMVDDLGRIAVRRVTRYYDEGIEIGKKYHRSWIMPGDNPEGNDVLSKAIATKLHTADVITAYETKMAEAELVAEGKLTEK